MPIYTHLPSHSSWAGQSSNSATETRANFARAAVFAEFGRHARALDYPGFIDRLPNEAPRRVGGQLAKKVA